MDGGSAGKAILRCIMIVWFVWAVNPSVCNLSEMLSSIFTA